MSAPSITPLTGKALRQVFQLLEDHFDGEAGCYKNDYTDERIAKETNISKEAVKQYRVNAFGKIKPPSEIEILRRELRELESFALTAENEMKTKAKDINLRLSAMERRFD